MFKTFLWLFGISLICYSQNNSILEQQIKLEKMKFADKEDNISTDNGIDPDSYNIGQGDQLTIFALNASNINFTGIVTLEADLFIPEIGLIKVGKMPLNQAKQVISSKLEEVLKGKNLQFYISLTKIKSATFSISGCVLHQGTYSMRGNYRLSDVLTKACKDSLLENVPFINLREIKLSNANDSQTIDLLRYFYKNDIDNNPYIYPDQNIYVPYVSEKIILTGPITNGFHGEIPIKKNESLRSILELCFFDNSADTSSIIVKRAHGNEIIRTSFGMSSEIILQDIDQVTISRKNNYPKVQMAAAYGELNRPGDVVIFSYKTTAKEVIEMAGGVTEIADIKRACIIRKKNNPNENISKTTSLTQFSPNVEISSSLNKMSNAKDYCILPLSNDLSEVLIENDRLYIPRKDKFIYISGAVNRAGPADYSNSKDIDDYLKNAGGISKTGDKRSAYVVSMYPENIFQIKGLNQIAPGDIIVVPEKQLYKKWNSIIIPLISTFLTSVSLFITLYNSTK
jgi:protein involved in polysaccharide export with SLBB domain